MTPGLRRFAVPALSVAAMLIRSVPPVAAIAAAEVGGRLWWSLDRRRRKRTRENLRAAYGDTRSERERRHLERAAFASMLRVAVETAWAERLLATPRQFASRTVREGDWDGLRKDVERGRGGLLLGGHFGNWELGGRSAHVHGVPMLIVARPFDQLGLDRFVARHRGGHRAVLGHRGRASGLVGALRRGSWVGALIDQNAGPQGVFVPFFGLLASTPAGPVRAAQQAGAPVWFGTVRRLAAPLHFALRLDRIDVGPPDADRDRLAEAVATIVAHLERAVREAPEQYNWLHRRWKSRPPGEAPNPRLPVYDHHAPGASERREGRDRIHHVSPASSTASSIT